MKDAQKVSLTAFLRARLDEDEGYLKSNQHHLWTQRPFREVEAKRAIIAACAETLQGEESHDYVTEGGSGEEYELARFTLRQLAAVYSDHPGYRQEWKS